MASYSKIYLKKLNIEEKKFWINWKNLWLNHEEYYLGMISKLKGECWVKEWEKNRCQLENYNYIIKKRNLRVCILQRQVKKLKKKMDTEVIEQKYKSQKEKINIVDELLNKYKNERKHRIIIEDLYKDLHLKHQKISKVYLDSVVKAKNGIVKLIYFEENLLFQFGLLNSYLKEKNKTLSLSLKSIQVILQKTKVCLTIQRKKTIRESKQNLMKNVQIKSLCEKIVYLQEKKIKNKNLRKKIKHKILNEMMTLNVLGELEKRVQLRDCIKNVVSFQKETTEVRKWHEKSILKFNIDSKKQRKKMSNSYKNALTEQKRQNQNKLNTLLKVLKNRCKKDSLKWKSKFDQLKCIHVSQIQYLITEINSLRAKVFLTLQLFKRNRVDYLKECKKKKVHNCKLKLLKNTISQVEKKYNFWKDKCNIHRNLEKQIKSENERLKLMLRRCLTKWNYEKDFLLRKYRVLKNRFIDFRRKIYILKKEIGQLKKELKQKTEKERMLTKKKNSL